MQPLTHKLIAFLENAFENEDFKREICRNTRVSKLPEVVRRHGLLQALVFLQGKAKSESGGISTDGQLLALWLQCVYHLGGRDVPEIASFDDLTDRLSEWRREIATSSPSDVMRETELGSFSATWLARLVDAMKAEV